MVTDQYLHTPYSLTDARVIYEIAYHEPTTATDICQKLGMDAGHLSRLLRNFKKRALIETQSSDTDGRRSLVRLTETGQEAFALLNSRSQHGIEALLNTLSIDDQHRVVDAMRTIETAFGRPSERKVPYLLRPHQSGDIGGSCIVTACCMSQEYGWNEHLKPSLRTSSPNLFSTMIPHGNAVGLPSGMARTSGQSFSCVILRRSLSCVCYWSNRPLADWGLERAWSMNAFVSPDTLATTKSCCGPIVCWSRPGIFMPNPAFPL